MSDSTQYREAWLTDAVHLLDTNAFGSVGLKLPDKWRVSCGFPKGGKSGNAVIGQCWYPASSGDGSVEMFISPVLAKPVEVISTLIHECIHAGLPVGVKHKKPFKDVAVKLGLEGKMTATVPGTQLIERINDWLVKLPPYPHAALVPALIKAKGETCRLLKIECLSCGYVCRTTQKWIDVGLPTCFCGEPMVVSD